MQRHHHRLAAIAAHVTARTAASQTDVYANSWSLDGAGKLHCLPAEGSAAPEPVTPELPFSGGAAGLAVDDNGYIWVVSDAGRDLHRLDPRGPHYGPAGGGGGVEMPEADPTRHKIWRAFDMSLLDGQIDTIQSSTTHQAAVVTLDSGERFEVSMDQAFACAVEPAPAASAAVPRWEALGGRLPCSNHDIYAAECNGKIYVSGGALWYRGYPARMAEFDELWVMDDPAKADEPTAW